MIARISQAQADDAAAEAAAFWPEFGRRWPWTRAQAPVYQRVGEQTVALLRAFPAIQWSNQARWYRRVVRETPAIIALPPDALLSEARNIIPGADTRALEGKSVLSLVYLPDEQAQPDDASATEPPIAKTLLASSALDAPLYYPQLAHELLNCFCSTDWDGRMMRNGLRSALRETASPAPGQAADANRGAAHTDLLLDAMLVHYLPAATPIQPGDLFEGAQGPYWKIAQTLALRLRGVPALAALFSDALDARERFERGLAVALDTADAARELDALAAAHDWAGLHRLLGMEP